MPITVHTASVTIGNTFMHRGLPPLLLRSTRFCTRAAATPAAPGVLALFGLTGTHTLVGSTLLNTVLGRTTCNFLKPPAKTATPWVAMLEPYGSLIGTMHSALLKLGFIKIHESEHAMTFSDGANKIDFTVTDRHFHPVLSVYFIARNGAHFSMTSLRDRFNSAQTKRRESVEFCATNEEYGLWDCTTPPARKEAGFIAGVLLELKHTVTFLKTHQQALSELGSNDEFD